MSKDYILEVGTERADNPQSGPRRLNYSLFLLLGFLPPSVR